MWDGLCGVSRRDGGFGVHRLEWRVGVVRRVGRLFCSASRGRRRVRRLIRDQRSVSWGTAFVECVI
jgi:hypothetical protein